MGLLNKIIWGRVITDIATIGKKKVPLSKVIVGAYALEVVERNHREQLDATRSLEAAIREANRTPDQRAEENRLRALGGKLQELEFEEAKEKFRIKLFDLDGGFIARITLKYALRKAMREGGDQQMLSMIRTAIEERRILHPVGGEWFRPEAAFALRTAVLNHDAALGWTDRGASQNPIHEAYVICESSGELPKGFVDTLVAIVEVGRLKIKFAERNGDLIPAGFANGLDGIARSLNEIGIKA